jgi:hypothetical protein
VTETDVQCLRARVTVETTRLSLASREAWYPCCSVAKTGAFCRDRRTIIERELKICIEGLGCCTMNWMDELWHIAAS